MVQWVLVNGMGLSSLVEVLLGCTALMRANSLKHPSGCLQLPRLMCVCVSWCVCACVSHVLSICTTHSIRLPSHVRADKGMENVLV